MRSTQASLRQHTTWQLQSMRSRVKELARRRRGQQEAATIWTRCQTKRWRRMVEGQQDLPGVRPGPAPPTPSTPSPLLSLPRSGQTVGSRCQFCFQGTQCSSWWIRSGCCTGFPGVPGGHWTWTGCCKVFLLPYLNHHNMCLQTSGLRLEDLQLQLLPAPQPGLPRTCSRLP